MNFMGIGDWGLGIGPIPNPQSPIPKNNFKSKQYFAILICFILFYLINFYINLFIYLFYYILL